MSAITLHLGRRFEGGELHLHLPATPEKIEEQEMLNRCIYYRYLLWLSNGGLPWLYSRSVWHKK